jgi:benzoate 4-monooxygenase
LTTLILHLLAYRAELLHYLESTRPSTLIMTLLETLTLRGLWVPIAIISAIGLVYQALYPWLFSPLRNIPGPWYAVYTKWWMAYKTFKGIRAVTIHDLHRRYGPWVRIAPEEVSTCDTEAIAPIYGVNSKFVKTDFYTYQLRGFEGPEFLELFTYSNRQAHATRRRQLANLFSMSTLIEYEPVIADNVKRCMDLIASENQEGRLSNLYDWWHYLSMDIVCELAFGSTFNMLKEGTKNPYIKDMYGSLAIEPVRWHFGWLNKFTAWAPFKFICDAEACSVRAFDKGVRMVQEYKQNPERKRSKDLLQRMLDARDNEGRPLPDNSLNVQATSFLLGGSHTTSSSLTWIVWRILKTPAIRKRLVEELDEALAGLPRNAVPTHQKLEKLTYLNYIIKEGLRIDTAVPGSVPRYVPPGGAHINGRVLPAGSIISMQSYTCHRDPTVFSNPDEFLPERWADETPEMRKSYVPFGADGPRKCIGMWLAYLELRVILASLFYRFDLSFAYNITDESMGMHELWLANPIGQHLDVIAKERVCDLL